MEVIDYFRILKAFLIFFFMNNVPDQNGKKLEEILAGSNSDAVKTIESSASCHFRVTLSLGVETVTNGSVG